VHCVIVILGVGRIDGDESNVTPVLAAGRACRPCGVRFVERGAREHMWNIVGMDGDDADGALGRE
jgi:hypothetical protein